MTTTKTWTKDMGHRECNAIGCVDLAHCVCGYPWGGKHQPDDADPRADAAGDDGATNTGARRESPQLEKILSPDRTVAGFSLSELVAAHGRQGAMTFALLVVADALRESNAAFEAGRQVERWKDALAAMAPTDGAPPPEPPESPESDQEAAGGEMGGLHGRKRLRRIPAVGDIPEEVWAGTPPDGDRWVYGVGDSSGILRVESDGVTYSLGWLPWFEEMSSGWWSKPSSTFGPWKDQTWVQSDGSLVKWERVPKAPRIISWPLTEEIFTKYALPGYTDPDSPLAGCLAMARYLKDAYGGLDVVELLTRSAE